MSENAAAAGSAARRSSSVGKAADKPLARDAGNVPKYLQRVKAAIAAEEKLIAERLGLNKDPDEAPPGCRLLPEDERLETLRLLQAKKADVEAQHRKLPLKIETLGQKQRAQEVERELKVVEQGIETFSKPKVFIRM